MKNDLPARFDATKRGIASLSLAAAFASAASLPCSALAAEAAADGDKEGGHLALDLSLDTSMSKYGSSSSHSSALTASISYDTDAYGISLAIPYVSQSDSADSFIRRFNLPPRITSRIVSKFGPQIAKLTTPQDVKASGLGDIEGSFTRYLIDNAETGLTLDVRGIVKFATADQAKGLGTGKNDYTIEANLGKTIGRFTATGTAGYSLLGSPGSVVVQGTRQNIVLDNLFFGALDGAFRVAEKARVGATLNAAQAAAPDAYSQKDVTLYFNFSPSKSTRVRVFGQKGLADGSADSAAGASATLSF